MINGRIRADRVRLIDESQQQVGIIDLREAIQKARDVGMDLVEVGPTSTPPVCRIMDYGKWLYQQKRKIRDANKQGHKHSKTRKEIRLRPETEEHDLDIKLRHARQFLEKGYKVQFTMQFRGRQMLHQDRGYKVMEEIQNQLQDLAKVLSPCIMKGRRMVLVLAAK